ncbi:uncharacterized protein LOC132613787 [Lycium barbarum]|uniref:uncharacterized protein LOC132613787 n=1 Tax=Lycium barbarum TaxID=112863 RepID=UPI00293F2EA5|nr:uncharacterized protein LOC132613787 [Lycium barbarum]
MGSCTVKTSNRKAGNPTMPFCFPPYKARIFCYMLIKKPNMPLYLGRKKIKCRREITRTPYFLMTREPAAAALRVRTGSSRRTVKSNTGKGTTKRSFSCILLAVDR